MTTPRLVLVTRRFWPLVGGTERAMAGLATEFRARGLAVTLLTARWEPAWPTKLVFCGVPVVRLPQPPTGPWGTLYYMFQLARWLRRHRRQYDLVYVSMLKQDAAAALLSVAHRASVVLRAEQGGAAGDCHWQRETWGGRWIGRRCRAASAWVAPTPAIAAELRQAGYAEQRIRTIPDGVPIPPPSNLAIRAAARQALGDTQEQLRLDTAAPLAVYTGRLHPDKGLYYLLKAWRQVVQRQPEARLWLVGSGPHRAALEDQIESLGLWRTVVLAGTFDQVDEILAAADLFVYPSCEEELSRALVEAMAAGLAIVASNTAGNRLLLDEGRHALLVPARASEPLAAAILRLLEDPPLAARLGAAARCRAEQEFSLARCADRHLELFAQLLTPGDENSS